MSVDTIKESSKTMGYAITGADKNVAMSAQTLKSVAALAEDLLKDMTALDNNLQEFKI